MAMANAVKSITGETTNKTMLEKTNVSMTTSLRELDIDIKFQSIIPQDIKELIDAIAVSTAGESTMSQQTGSKINPLIESQNEYDKIIEEKKSEQQIAGTFNFEE